MELRNPSGQIIRPNIECKICSKICTNGRSLAQHVSGHQLTSKIYYDTYLKPANEGICVRPTKYLNLVVGYQKNCGTSCGASERAKMGWSVERLQNHKCNWTPLKGGRPEGSKNKQPYPSAGRDAHHRYWNTLTQEERLQIYKKRNLTGLDKGITKAGENRVSYKGMFTPKNPQKYEGDSKNIVWRSLLENRMMHYLDDTSSIIKWASEEISIPYISPLDGRMHLYYPDFVITRTTDGKLKNSMIEIKPSKECLPPVKSKRNTQKSSKRFLRETATYAKNQAKWESAKKFCESKGWDFLIITEKTLQY